MPINLYSYELKTRCPFIEKREGLILEHNGGWGEIAPLTGFSKEGLIEATQEVVKHLPSLAPSALTLPSVKFGVESALFPFSLEPLSVPIATFGALKDGASTVKLKLGSLDLAKAIDLASRYLGKGKIRLDFNRMWPLEKLLAFSKEFSPDDFEFLEEPAQNLDELIAFSEKTAFPIAIDESLQEKGWKKIPTLKAAVVKPTLFPDWNSLPKDLPIVFSSSYESSLGILQIARLAKNSPFPAGIDTFSDDLLNPPLKIEKGHLIWEPKGAPFIRKEKLCLIAAV